MPFKNWVFTFFMFLFVSNDGICQKKKQVLFLGNSYIGVNNLPFLVSEMAKSMGDTLIFNSNTPGGFTLAGHSTNAVTLQLIAQNHWDFVVLQEQSQRPAFPPAQVMRDVVPAAILLDSLIRTQNNCAKTIFYQTWGRANGDASNCAVWPPICTYHGMDSMLARTYRMLADTTSAMIAPVGAVWRYLRANNPTIDLYQSDESHPAMTGSIAAAATFYTMIFGRNPLLINYNAGLNLADFNAILQAVKTVVFDSAAYWGIQVYNPKASFNFQLNGLQLNLQNNSKNATSYFWDFGDGATDTSQNPIHTFQRNGNYWVTLSAANCHGYDTLKTQVLVLSIVEKNSFYQGIGISPNPNNGVFTISSTSEKLALILVFDSTGKLLEKIPIHNQKQAITLNQKAGIYFLQFTGISGEIAHKKIVIW